MKIDYLGEIQKVLDSNEKEKNTVKARNLFLEAAPEYKHRLSGMFVLGDGNKISETVNGSNLVVTRKLDGEMRTVFFDGTKSYMYTTGGKEETDFPCLKELTEKLKKSGIGSIGFAAELNVIAEDTRRTRVTDVIHAINDSSLHETLALSPFDLLLLENKKWLTEHYSVTYSKIEEIFGTYENACKEKSLIRPVQMEKATNAQEVQEIYDKWVCTEKAEGIVVHSEFPFIWKIKPQHSVDAVAVGFTVSENAIRDILFAVIEEDKTFRLFAGGSNGLTDDQRKILFTQFEAIKASANFVYTDSRGVSYQFIRPKYVFETAAIDFASENCIHEPYKNKIILFDENKGWSLEKIANGVVTYSLKIVRLREDKKPVFEDVRSKQIFDICPFSNDSSVDEIFDEKNLPESKIIQRYVYKKLFRSKVLVKKFLIIKTNKEQTGKYPAYILHFTDFNPRRKEILKIKTFVSSDEESLEEKLNDLTFEEINEGWQYE